MGAKQTHVILPPGPSVGITSSTSPPLVGMRIGQLLYSRTSDEGYTFANFMFRGRRTSLQNLAQNVSIIQRFHCNVCVSHDIFQGAYQLSSRLCVLVVVKKDDRCQERL